MKWLIGFQAETDSSYRVESLKCESESSTSTAGSIAGSLFRMNASQSYDFSVDEEMSGAGDFARDLYGGSESDSLNHNNEEDSLGSYFSKSLNFQS